MLFRELPTRLDWIGSVVRWEVRKPVVYLVARLYSSQLLVRFKGFGLKDVWHTPAGLGSRVLSSILLARSQTARFDSYLP